MLEKDIEESCYWLAARGAAHATESGSDLRQNAGPSDLEKCQIAIVGAGFTGLWTALFLKELDPDADIVVVEQGVTGYGASGRNAGMISNCIDHSHSLAITHFGEEEARKLAAIGLANIQEMAQFATDCDLELSGQLFVALKTKHMEDLAALLEAAAKLNISGYKLLDQQAVQAKLNSPLYVGGAVVPGGGIIDPIKLIDKLASTLRAKGVRIFERCRVTSLSESGLEAVWQPEKAAPGKAIRVQSTKTILATDAYTHHLLPGLLWRFVPLYDYILVSEPLSTEQLASIGWQGREGIVDGRTFFNYYRLTADNRILWGTSEAMYYPPNQVGAKYDHSQHHYTTLKESFDRHFPQLKGIAWQYGWGGPIASTTRLTPFFGTAHNGKVLYALGYTGHGIGSTRLAGKVLAHLALQKDSDLLRLKLVTDKPFPYPPEPLRSVAINMVTGSLRQVDAGKSPNLLLKTLDLLGIGFSS